MGAPKGNQYAVGNPGGGRPSVYDPSFCKIAKTIAELGGVDRDIAEALGISEQTVVGWKLRHKDFFNALRVSKETADERVKQGLYKRAIGFHYEAEKIAINAEGEVTRAETLVYVPPDPGAALKWLAARQSAEWREKQELELTATVQVQEIRRVVLSFDNPDASGLRTITEADKV